MSMLRAAGIRVLAVAIGIMVPLLLLEAVFRFLPVSDSRQVSPVDGANPIYHFKPDTTFTLSTDWNFAIVTRKRTNNRGFFSDIDYLRNDRRKLVVIGDSYVEAVQVENAQSIHGVLNRSAQPHGEVYGIGASGAPLSQYLAYAEFAAKEFSPSGLVFVVIANDFDESLPRYGQNPGFHYFVERSQGSLELGRGPDYRAPRSKEILRQSALARYLYLNLNMPAVWQRLSGRLAEQQFVANTSNDVSPERLADARRAIDYFLGELPARTARLPALFVVDGIRPDLYAPDALAKVRGGYVDRMRAYFIDRARAAGHEVIDMQDVFIEHYAAQGKRFEFPTDAHWNALGHRIAAEQVMRSRLWGATFPGERTVGAADSVRY